MELCRMRILHCLAVLTGLCVGLTHVGQSATMITGRLDVPPNIVPRIANSSISNLFGVPLGTANRDGSYSLPPSPLNDIEIIFVRPVNSDDVIIMGYADGDIYNIGIEGTALAMLLMANPANGALDVQAKRDLLAAARKQPDFLALTHAIQQNLTADSDVSSAHDRTIVGLLARIQARLPQARPNPAMFDPSLVSAN